MMGTPFMWKSYQLADQFFNLFPWYPHRLQLDTVNQCFVSQTDSKKRRAFYLSLIPFSLIFFCCFAVTQESIRGNSGVPKYLMFVCVFIVGELTLPLGFCWALIKNEDDMCLFYFNGLMAQYEYHSTESEKVKKDVDNKPSECQLEGFYSVVEENTKNISELFSLLHADAQLAAGFSN